MPKPKGLDANGLRTRRFWPSLSPDQQQTVIDFLAYYRALAEQGQAKASELAAIASQDLGMAENALWWAHVVRSIDWLISYVPKKQWYLEVQQAQREGRWRDTVSGPGT